METLAERRMDVACVQETWWRGSGCRFFGAIGKRYKLFWMGSKATTDGVGVFVNATQRGCSDANWAVCSLDRSH